MNKIYKLIWNKTRNMYVAVSEITKSHRKETTRQRKRLALLMTVALSVFFSGMGSMAADVTPLTDEQKAIVKAVIQSIQNDDDLGRELTKQMAEKFKNVDHEMKNVFISHLVGLNDVRIAGGRVETENQQANAIAIGNGSFGGNEYSIAMGYQAQAPAKASISIGQSSSGLHNGDIAIGYNTHVSGISTSVGQQNNVYGLQSIAIGSNINLMGEEALEQYEKYNYTNPALKGSIKTIHWYWKDQIQKNTPEIQAYKKKYERQLQGIKRPGKPEEAFYNDLYDKKLIDLILWEKSAKTSSHITALGYGTSANVNGGVALGAFSKATRKSEVVGYNPDGEPYTDVGDYLTKTNKKEAYISAAQELEALNAEVSALEAKRKKASDDEYKTISEQAYEKKKLAKVASKKVNDLYNAWVSVQSAVSIGNEETGMTRQITGLAAGSEDSDAVNVAQLKALNKKVDNNKIHYFSVNSSGAELTKPEENSDNSKNDGASGAHSLAIGYKAKAANDYSTAVGKASAIGHRTTAMGWSSLASDKGAHAYGVESLATEEQTSAFGIQSVAMGYGATSLGSTAISNEMAATSVGYNSFSGELSTAIGGQAYAFGKNSIALGLGAYAGDTDFKKAYAKQETAISYYQEVIKKDSEKMGEYEEKLKDKLKNYKKDSREYDLKLMSLIFDDVNKKVENATAIGNYATVGVTGGVALGYDSNATRKKGVMGYHLTDKAWGKVEDLLADENFKDKAKEKIQESYNAWSKAYYATEEKYKEWNQETNPEAKERLAKEWSELDKEKKKAKKELRKTVSAWQSGAAALSIGNEETGVTRQITGVAAGSEDSDAVNVAQLKALNKKVDTKAEETKTTINELKTQITSGGVHYFSVNSTENDADSNYKNDGAKQVGAIAIGVKAKSDGQSSIAMGYDSKVTGGWSIAIGQSSNVSSQQLGTAIGYGANVSGDHGVALGAVAKATHNYALALGGQAQALQENTIAIGVGTKSSQFGGVAIGQQSEVTQTAYKGIAIGAKAYVGPKGQGANPQDTKPESNWSFGENIDDKKPTTQGMTEQNAMAIGMNAKAFGYQTTALGAGAEAHDTNTVAIGIGTVAKGHYSTAVGKQAQTYADEATAVGHFAMSVGKSSSALGALSYAYGATSLALGAKSRAVDNNSVAIGANALAQGVKDGKALYSEEEIKATAGIVSVGNPEHEVTKRLRNQDGSTFEKKEKIAENYRRIVNMAGGIDDHDAVNVAQLRALANAPIRFFTGGSMSDGKYVPSTTVGETWKGSRIVFGDGITATQLKDEEGNIYTKITATGGGTGGTPGLNGKDGKSAFDIWKEENNKPTATKQDFLEDIKGQDGTNGTNGKDGLNGKSAYEIWRDKTVDGKQPNKDKKVEDFLKEMKGGTDFTVSVDPVVKDKKTEIPSFAVTKDKPALHIVGDGGNIATTIEKGNTVKVALNKDIKVDSVEVGGKDGVRIDNDGVHAGKKQITDVAAGEKDTDAVNVGQLKGVAQQTGKVAQALGEVKNESTRGDAMGAALTALKPLAYDPYRRSQMMAGVGTYKGKQAVALGWAHYSNENTLFHGGISYGGTADLLANLGVSIRFGDRTDKKKLDLRNTLMPQYAEGPMASVYVMQEEVTALRKENAEMKKEMEEMKKQIAMLLAKK